MNRYFTKTFTKFLFAFIAILAIALGVMVAAGIGKATTNPIDNLAQPQ